MTLFRRLSLVAAIVLLTGCTTLQGFSLRPYRMNVQQGNFLEAKDVDQIEVGMTRNQVRFLIGTPMVADPFNVRAGTTCSSSRSGGPGTKSAAG
jgi:outer membrane protein assembly factor BamE